MSKLAIMSIKRERLLELTSKRMRTIEMEEPFEEAKLSDEKLKALTEGLLISKDTITYDCIRGIFTCSTNGIKYQVLSSEDIAIKNVNDLLYSIISNKVMFNIDDLTVGLQESLDKLQIFFEELKDTNFRYIEPKRLLDYLREEKINLFNFILNLLENDRFLQELKGTHYGRFLITTL